MTHTQLIGDTLHMTIAPDISPFFSGRYTLTRRRDSCGALAFRRWGLLWKIPLYDFRNGFPPLCYHDADGTCYQPDNHFETDGGSIPPPMWGLSFVGGALNFERAFLLHDSAFRYGGLYVRRYPETRYAFRLLSRQFCDGLLRRMARADGANRLNAASLRLGVYLGSRFAWSEKDQATSRARDKITPQ